VGRLPSRVIDVSAFSHARFPTPSASPFQQSAAEMTRARGINVVRVETVPRLDNVRISCRIFLSPAPFVAQKIATGRISISIFKFTSLFFSLFLTPAALFRPFRPTIPFNDVSAHSPRTFQASIISSTVVSVASCRSHIILCYIADLAISRPLLIRASPRP